MPLVYCLYNASMHADKFGIIYGLWQNGILIVISLCTLFLSLLLIKLTFFQPQRDIFICKNGVEIIDKKKYKLSWNMIQGVTYFSISYNLIHFPLYTSMHGCLYLSNGHILKLHSSIDNIKNLISIIKSHVYPLILPGFFQQLSIGDQINFGPLSIRQDSLIHGQKIIFWQNIKSILIKSGYLLVEFFEKQHKLKIPTYSIPNIELLFILINKYRGISLDEQKAILTPG